MLSFHAGSVHVDIDRRGRRQMLLRLCSRQRSRRVRRFVSMLLRHFFAAVFGTTIETYTTKFLQQLEVERQMRLRLCSKRLHARALQGSN